MEHRITGAFKWRNRSTPIVVLHVLWSSETGTKCSNSDQVGLSASEEPPAELTEMFGRSDFMSNIRRFNSVCTVSSKSIRLEVFVNSKKN